jgi:hypothetical protein
MRDLLDARPQRGPRGCPIAALPQDRRALPPFPFSLPDQALLRARAFCLADSGGVVRECSEK